jgi:hypothetical protein
LVGASRRTSYVRERENVIRRGVFKSRNERVRLEDLPFDFAQRTAAAPTKLIQSRKHPRFPLKPRGSVAIVTERLR